MPWVTDDNAALLTDMYELTMAASYFSRGMNDPASFELFVRHLPEHRSFLISCGVSDALDYLEKMAFDESALTYLRSLDLFDETFLAYLGELRFRGEVWAIPEGAAVFANEPILRVTAPLIQAQIVETFLLNCLTFQTLIASKAARIATACGDRTFVDFSPRRDHGADAAIRAARASYVGGASGTSNVLAGALFGMPVSGTMAHSYVMSFDEELESFRAFARDLPGRAILLIDTYDTVEGARRTVQVARELDAEGIPIQGVRLDSGDLAALAKEVRCVLDEGGCADTRIFASGDLDEYRITELLADGAPIDAFGVGTQLGTSADAPALGGVYKLVEDMRGPRVKLSQGKATLPGRKQVFRVTRGTRYDHDVLGLEGETGVDGEPVLRRMMEDGRRLEPPEPLEEARNRCAKTVSRLPDHLRALEGDAREYRILHSPGLQRLTERARREAGH